MELWQAMVTLDALEMTTYQGKQPFLTPEMRKNIQVVFQDNAVGPVDSLWPLVTGSVPIRQGNLDNACFGTVILPLPGSSSPFWDGHWKDKDCKNTFMLRAFLHRIYKTLGIEARNRSTEKPVVTIIDRHGGTRQIHNLTWHVEHLSRVFPDVTFNIIDFATVSLRKQIEISRGTDVLVGVMGAGMTHILFIPEEGSVAELMTPGNHYSGFRNLSKMLGLAYFTAHGLTKKQWAKQKAMQDGTQYVETDQQEEEPEEEHHDWRVDFPSMIAPGYRKRHWQKDEYGYFTQEMFTSLVGAAINAQLNRGLRSDDVKPVV